MIAAGNDTLFRQLCRALDMTELADEARFATNPERVAHRDELFDLPAQRTRELTTRGLWKVLGEHAVPAAPIQDMADVVRDEQVSAAGMLPRVDHPEISDYRDVALPIRWGGERPRAPGAPPKAGQHTREILGELGYAREKVDAWVLGGVVAVEEDD